MREILAVIVVITLAAIAARVIDKWKRHLL